MCRVPMDPPSCTRVRLTSASLSLSLPLPPLLHLPSRSVALIQPPLPRRLTLGRVGDAVIMVALERLIDSLAPSRQGFLRRLCRNQTVTAVADEVLTAGLHERLPDGEPVFRLEKLHQGALHLP